MGTSRDAYFGKDNVDFSKKQMKENSYICAEDEMHGLAEKVVNSLEETNLVLLRGDLGAGKTTFVQHALDYLGAEGPFTSPTFVIMKRYAIESEKYDFVYHLDCYRVGKQDVLDLGWEEIITDPRNLVFVEWPEKIWDIISKEYMLIDIKITDTLKRELNVSSENKVK